jgi:hypothetical protein
MSGSLVLNQNNRSFYRSNMHLECKKVAKKKASRSHIKSPISNSFSVIYNTVSPFLHDPLKTTKRNEYMFKDRNIGSNETFASNFRYSN